jgi:hypothetical protein
MNEYDGKMQYHQRERLKRVWPAMPNLPPWLLHEVMQYPQKPAIEQVKQFQLSLERMLDLGNSKRWTLYCTLAAWLQNQASSKQEVPSSPPLAAQDLGLSTFSIQELSRLIDIQVAPVRAEIRRTSPAWVRYEERLERRKDGSLWWVTSPKSKRG